MEEEHSEAITLMARHEVWLAALASTLTDRLSPVVEVLLGAASLKTESARFQL